MKAEGFRAPSVGLATLLVRMVCESDRPSYSRRLMDQPMSVRSAGYASRSAGYQKRGGHRQAEPLDEAATLSPTRDEQLVALDDAMQRLASISKRKSDVVELRFFGGLSVEETAQYLGISRLTVIRDWNFARAWLLAEMSGKNPTSKEA